MLGSAALGETSIIFTDLAKNNNKKEKMLVFTSEAEGPVLLVVDRGRRVVEVHRPQRRRVDGVLGIVHPQAVSHLAK